MKIVRTLAWVLLASIFGASAGAELLALADYSQQFRESPNRAPSAQFPLGTDDLGRDRFSRLLYGSRVSLFLAAAAAALATLIAAAVGATGGYLGGVWEKTAMSGTDLVLSLPWLFLLLAARAALPLNAPPLASMSITFFLLGLLGWAAGARVVRAATRAVKESEYVLQARASGCGPFRIIVAHVLPNLKPVLIAQFWLSIPTFILSEANLGLLGLGVSEPMPSLGTMLREMESVSRIASYPWIVAPALLLLLVVSCFQVVLRGEQRPL
ncbi:MAG: ABC transporter permease [Bryobacterales bacterium]|nr:ABC transporter permease [Bryobacterales bacterium]